MDPVFSDLIITTYASSNPSSSLYKDEDRISELSRLVAKPPRSDSLRLADQVTEYVRLNPDNRFAHEFNGPQVSAIHAALSRRLTMIQGPPGTGVCQ